MDAVETPGRNNVPLETGQLEILIMASIAEIAQQRNELDWKSALR